MNRSLIAIVIVLVAILGIFSLYAIDHSSDDLNIAFPGMLMP